jgi:4-hydroxybenzoate polyprenyltransferase
MPDLMPETPPTAVDSRTTWRAAVEACFYGQLFYGVCAVAQVFETSAQLALPVSGWLTVGSFMSTVLFYSYPYTRRTANGADPRVDWYRRNRALVDRLRRWALLALIALSVWLAIRHRAAIRTMTPFEWTMLLVFPGAGGLYYGAPVLSRAMTLRHLGWLKPFVIGFVWAGAVVAYPILFARLQYGHHTPFSFFPCLLFVKTLMFVAVLAMLFDIKDRDTDQGLGLSTIPTLVGLERTLFQVSLPLTVLGVVTFLSYAAAQQMTAPRVLLVLAPFGLLVAGIASLSRPRTLLYYLTVVDGLMLAKALLDILAFRL